MAGAWSRVAWVRATYGRGLVAGCLGTFRAPFGRGLVAGCLGTLGYASAGAHVRRSYVSPA
eukprot:245839-Prymnesium_polylepis.1